MPAGNEIFFAASGKKCAFLRDNIELLLQHKSRMNQEEHIARLLSGLFSGMLGPAGRKELDAWLDAAPENRAVLDDFRNWEWFQRQQQLFREVDRKARWNEVLRRTRIWTAALLALNCL